MPVRFVISGIIIFNIFYDIGQILLLHPVIFKIVGINVKLTFNLCVLSVKMLVLKITRDWAVFTFFNISQSGVNSRLARIAFGADATRITASASGIRASGSPTAIAVSTAALTIGII